MVKGDTLQVQNCHELKSSTLGFLRSLRSPRSNDLETQNYKTPKPQNPKGKNDLVLSTIKINVAFIVRRVVQVSLGGPSGLQEDRQREEVRCLLAASRMLAI